MGKRNEVMIMEDRAKVCELYAKGYTSATEIASIINIGRDLYSQITTHQVRQDLKYMEKKYIESGVVNYALAVNQSKYNLNLLKRTLWEGYQLSRKKKITIESQEVLTRELHEEMLEYGTSLDVEDLYSEHNPEEKMRAAKIKEEMRGEGNIAFLQGILAVEDRLNKLDGIDTPSKFAFTDVTGQKDVMGNPLEEMKNLIASVLPKAPEQLPEPDFIEAEIDDEYSYEQRGDSQDTI